MEKPVEQQRREVFLEGGALKYFLFCSEKGVFPVESQARYADGLAEYRSMEQEEKHVSEVVEDE